MINKDKFKDMISQMEQSTMKENKQCNRKCAKIKTNFGKNKKKLTQKKKCHSQCETKRLQRVKKFHNKYPKEYKRFVASLGGGSQRKRQGKKKTSRKSKKKTKSKSAYFEYKNIIGSIHKFWRIVKDGTKITTHYGKIGSLGRMTTKDYGTKVDVKYDQLIQSKKKKGYFEVIDYGDKKPKPPTNIQREYLKICREAEKNSKLNPGSRNFDCEGILDWDDETLQWRADWYKDAMKKGKFNWSKYEKHARRK